MSNVDLMKLIQRNVLSLEPYHVEDNDCKIKLHANENPKLRMPKSSKTPKSNGIPRLQSFKEAGLRSAKPVFFLRKKTGKDISVTIWS